MSVLSYLLGIAMAAFTLVVVIEMLRRGKLRERHALWWVIAGSGALLIAIFPALLTGAARLLGVALPVNLIFFLSTLILFLVCIQQSAELTEVESKTRRLAEEVALANLRIERLERDIASAVEKGQSAPNDPRPEVQP